MSDVLTSTVSYELDETVAELAAASRGDGTVRAYRSQWGQFTQWCASRGYDPYDGEHVIARNIAAAYKAGLSASTIAVRLAAIEMEYAKAGFSVDTSIGTLGEVREGARRKIGVAARHQAEPIRPDVLRAMLKTRWDAGTAKGARDRAMLLLAFGGFMRRSEVTGLCIGDVVEDDGGLTITIRRSKTDQTGEGAAVWVYGNAENPYLSPLLAWRNWMAHRSAASDMQIPVAQQRARPLFTSVRKDGWIDGESLTPHYVSATIKEAAGMAGLDPAIFSAHSIRRGAMTAAAEDGVDVMNLAKQARHNDLRMAVLYTNQSQRKANRASAAALGVRA